MKRKEVEKMKRKIMSIILMMAMLVCGISFQNVKKVFADEAGVYQPDDNYSLSTKKLVTRGILESADETLKKQKRVYKITAKTKFYKIYENKGDKRVRLKGKAIKKAIKEANKKKEMIQFKPKKGRLIFVRIIVGRY